MDFLGTKKDLVILVGIVLLGAVLRLFLLGQVPFGVTHDELGYFYNAYAIAKTGQNVFSERLPLFTWMVRDGFPFLPVPIYLSALFFFFLPLSAFSGRLPDALLGIGDIVLLYLLVRRLFPSTPLALISAFFLAISPWHLHFSRSAYDPNFALFFYLLGIILYLAEAEKKHYPLLSTLSFLLALFSYRGMNVVFLPLSLLLLWYSVTQYKLNRKAIFLRCLGLLFVVLTFFLVVQRFGSSYTSEAMFYKDPKIQEQVDRQIRESKGPLFIRRIFLNKITFLAGTLRDNYLGSYSPDFLFLHTESNAIYSIWSRGRIYFLDIFFILLGIFALFKKKKEGFLFVLAAVAIAGLPGLLGGGPYSARNFFMSAFIPVFTASGVIALVGFKKVKWYRIGSILFLSLIYFYSFSGYLFDYYERYAYQSAEAWAKSLKDISNLIMSQKGDYNEIVVGNTSFGDVVQYAFYSKTPVVDVQSAWKNKTYSSDGKEIYALGNVVFESGCKDLSKNSVSSTLARKDAMLLVERGSCKKDLAPLGKIQDYYGNIIWSTFRQ